MAGRFCLSSPDGWLVMFLLDDGWLSRDDEQGGKHRGKGGNSGYSSSET